MPILLPTVAEQQAMSWRAREQARRAVLTHVAEVRQHRLLQEHDLLREETGAWSPTRTIDTARQLLAAMPPDPDAAAHRALLLQAVV